jgi:hypothetical protein
MAYFAEWISAAAPQSGSHCRMYEGSCDYTTAPDGRRRHFAAGPHPLAAA